MAIVTRRYLYQGPPSQDIRNKTDPGLTLASAALKLAFDVTFDNAVADVAAVDQAMADSGGFVPDPSANTAVPPSFPGSGSSTALIFRPGSGLPGPIIFDSWTDLMAQLAMLRGSANGGGNYMIVIDDSVASPATLPVGVYNMAGIALAGVAGKLTALTVPEGVILNGLRLVTDNLQITFTGATPPVADFAIAPFESFAISRGAQIATSGTGPFLRNSATFLVLALINGGKIGSSGTQAVDIAAPGPSVGAMIIGFASSEFGGNALSGVAGAQAQLSWESSSALLSEDQPAFTGAGGVLSLKNDTFERRFPTPVITANTGIGPSEVARVDTNGGPVTITLPPAFNNRGLKTIVKDVGGVASGMPITIVPSGTDTVDGNPSATLNVDKGALSFVSDGVSDWMIV